MNDWTNPAHVAAELRRRGLPVFTTRDVIHTDERLAEWNRLARLGGRAAGEYMRAKYVNRGRLLEALTAGRP